MLKNTVGWLLGYREVPFSSRAIFRVEFVHMLTWGVVWGSLNGSFCGYIALTSLQASDLLVSIIAAAMAFANLFAMYWAPMSQRVGQRKLMTVLLAGVSVMLLSLALTPMCDVIEPAALPNWFRRLTSPTAPLTALVFTLQIVALWVALQGINTVRTSVWKNNYPDAYRGRILARFAIWQMLVGAGWVACMGAYLDGALRLELFGRVMLDADLDRLYGAGEPGAYRYLFPIAGAAGLLSLMSFSRMQIRGTPQNPEAVTASNRLGTEALETHDTTPGWFATRVGVLRAGLGQAWRTMQADAPFRRYMGWMFVSGSSIMMIQVPLVLLLKNVFDIGYLQAAGLLTFVPQIAVILCTPLWARLFDHWPLLFYRAVQTGVWVVNRALLAWAVYRVSMPLLLVAVTVGGLAMAGGRFAWHLGHMDFSNKSNDSIYLGIHQTFTGLRGLVMPFLGAALYRYAFGWHVIWISGALLLLAMAGYWHMHRARTAAERRGRD